MDNWTLGVEPVNGKIEIRLTGSNAKPANVQGVIYNRDGLPYVKVTHAQDKRIRQHFGMKPGYDEDWCNLKGDYEGVFVYVVGAEQDRWPECDHCFRALREDEDIFVEPEGVFCESCYIQLYNKCCWWCEIWFQEGNMREACDPVGGQISVCEDCLEKHFEDCDECGYSYPRYVLQSAVGWDNKEVKICPKCFKGSHYCETCDRYVDAGLVNTKGECIYCHEERIKEEEEDNANS
jgi:hypothetical protein